MGWFEGLGKIGNTSSPYSTLALFETVLSGIIGVLTLVAGIWFIFLFLTGSLEWLSSGGDKNRLASAQAKLTHGVIGLAIVVAAIFIISLIGTLLGVEFLKPLQVANNFVIR